MKFEHEGIYKLHNDASTKKKIKFMSRWEALLDDARNPEADLEDKINAFLKLGKTYEIKITIEVEQLK